MDCRKIQKIKIQSQWLEALCDKWWKIPSFMGKDLTEILLFWIVLLSHFLFDFFFFFWHHQPYWFFFWHHIATVVDTLIITCKMKVNQTLDLRTKFAVCCINKDTLIHMLHGWQDGVFFRDNCTILVYFLIHSPQTHTQTNTKTDLHSHVETP